jgi:hypothetical protein
MVFYLNMFGVDITKIICYSCDWSLSRQLLAESHLESKYKLQCFWWLYLRIFKYVKC